MTLKLAELEPQDDPFAALLKSKLIDIIRWSSNQAPRSKQVNMGPSEIGDLCDRRLGYRLAEIPQCNTEFDPWPSIMGTAVHTWLEGSVSAWMNGPGLAQEHHWATEQTLHVDEFVTGHADLYLDGVVIDWKTAGPDVMKKTIAEGPPERYQVQAHVYGYGFEQAGYKVDKVALAFLPRAGWLRDMYVWAEDYSAPTATVAISRVYGIAQNLVEMEISKDSNSHRWEQVNAVPSNGCGFCPWYDPGRDSERGADATGCPGR